MASMTSQFLNASSDSIVGSIVLGAPKLNSAGGKSIDINNITTNKPVLIRFLVWANSCEEHIMRTALDKVKNIKEILK